MDKKIYITVDVECHNLSEENLYIYGVIKGKKYGIEKIMDIGDKYNVPINFFVNIVERHKYPEEYVQRIVKTIKDRGHPIYLHLHPSCIKQDGRPFFWHYSPEEQDEIMKVGLADYKELIGDKCSAFRAGSYSSDQNMYNSLSKIIGKTVDLSYCYDYTNMCHYYPKVINKSHFNNDVFVIPNTRYCSLNIFKKKKYNNLDINSSYFSEMKDVLDNNKLNYLICTMHSWNLVDSWFYKGKTMKPHKKNISKMEKFIIYAQSKGYVFSKFDDLDNYVEDQEDDALNICNSFGKKIRGLWLTFFRMQRVAKSNKKYLLFYICFYSFIVLLITAIVLLIIFLH